MLKLDLDDNDGLQAVVELTRGRKSALIQLDGSAGQRDILDRFVQNQPKQQPP